MPANGRWDLIRRLKVNVSFRWTFLLLPPAVSRCYHTFTPNISILLYFSKQASLNPKAGAHRHRPLGVEATKHVFPSNSHQSARHHINFDCSATPLCRSRKVNWTLRYEGVSKVWIQFRELRNSALAVGKRPDFTNRMLCPRA